MTKTGTMTTMPNRAQPQQTPASPSLCQILDRVLDKGAVVSGEVTLSLAGIDLVYLNLKLLLVSSAKLYRLQPNSTALGGEQ
jgi:gas vesicle structural protein